MGKEIVKVIPSFSSTIFNDSVIDLAQDYGEMAIDAVMEDGILKDIPIVSTLAGFGKTLLTIRDRHFVKKTLIFAQKLNDGTLPKEKIEKHKRRLEENPRMLEKEMESIIIFIDRHAHYIKEKIFGNFYLARIDDDSDFDWEDFMFFADILDKISIYDLPELKRIYEKDRIGEGDKYDQVALTRLNSLGLAVYMNGMLVYDGEPDASSKAILAKISKLGKVFVEIGLNNIEII